MSCLVTFGFAYWRMCKLGIALPMDLLLSTESLCKLVIVIKQGVPCSHWKDLKLLYVGLDWYRLGFHEFLFFFRMQMSEKILFHFCSDISFLWRAVKLNEEYAIRHTFYKMPVLTTVKLLYSMPSKYHFVRHNTTDY